jgi:hypothetical protein
VAKRQGKGQGSSMITIAVLTGLLVFVLFAMTRTGEVFSRILFQGIAPTEGSAP